MKNLNHSRTLAARLFAAPLLLASAVSALADVHYVDVNSANATPPYTNWTTAATNIQDAVDAAVAGDEIVVTNGIYGPVSVGKPLSVRSVNGPQLTAIDGGRLARCAYLTDGANLSGFTLTNGSSVGEPGVFAAGAGVACESGNAVVSNCVISGNHAFSGAAFFSEGGGAYGVTLNNCTLTNNSVDAFLDDSGPGTMRAGGGGAAYCTLNSCALAGNSVNVNNNAFQGPAPDVGYAEGGGAFFCTLNNCTLSHNAARGTSDVPFELRGATAVESSGGGAYGGTLNNCTLTRNQALPISGSWRSRALGGGAYGGTLKNCILFENTDRFGCGDCAWDPRFVDLAGGNLRLQSNSPCINAGLNAFAPAGPDLDRNPRIVGGTVDIGAYEYQSLDLVNCGVVSNQFGFNVTGQSNWVVVLEASSDFTNWTPLTTNTLGGRPFPFRDPVPPNLPQRFYRARQP